MVNEQSEPLGFFSKKLSEVESRYSTFDRELLSIFCAVKKWKDLLICVDVTVFTDYKPIIGAVKNPKTRDSQRQERQIAIINEYCSDVVHISGKENIVADTLSRQQVLVDTINTVETQNPSLIESEMRPFDLVGIAKEQKEMDFTGIMFKNFEIKPGVEFKCETSQPNPRPIVPENFRFEFFIEVP